MKKNCLIVDLGTGNSRVGLVNSREEIICLKSFENNYHKDYEYEDATYFMPEEWSKKIEAITAVGARQSIVLYNDEGKCFYGLSNIDKRGEAWVSEVGNSAEVYKISGRWLTCDFPAAKLLGLKKKHTDIYDEITKITSLSEWIGELFTGNICIDPSQGCETQLFDVDKMNWSQTLCEYFTIDKKILPKIKSAGHVLGKVKA